jgi:hypothetical protein
LSLSLCGCSQKINALLEVAKSQSKAQNQLAAETKYFNNLKTAIEEGRIKNGLSQAHIKRTIGSPVIIQDEDCGQRWVYKPAEATFFDNNKIYLYFNKQGLLNKYKVFEPEDSN